ncbi:MAG: histidine kinase [Pseudomonadota bacterium]
MTNLRQIAARLRTGSSRLARDKSGLALLEFAFGMPLVLMIGLYGLETANLALVNLKISQIALGLADNASRVGVLNATQIEQLREVDMNDVLQAARMQGASINLTTNGRITVSSLEADSAGTQRIHWQRCIGLKSGVGYDSSYGITAASSPGNPLTSDQTPYDPTAGVNTATGGNPDNSASHPGSRAVGVTGAAVVGMGDDAASAVTAPASGGVIFVEINYLYKPVVGNWLFGPSRIHYVASFIVRDNRDFTQIYNPVTTPVTPRATCNLYAT